MLPRVRHTHRAAKVTFHNPLGVPLYPCHIKIMSTYLVTQDGPVFEVRLDDAGGRVVATFSNRLAAEKFAEQQQVRDDSARNHSTDGASR